MSKRLTYINQLDSLRAIAAFMVIFHHFLREWHFADFHYGKYGVEIFFTISGFLITSILLKQKELRYPVLLKIKNFIIKRVLRLFPVYYLVLLFFSLLSLLGLYVWDKGNGIYYYTYTTNILFFVKSMQGVQLNHFWTLAVEEQFYLIWPFIVFYSSNKNLKWILISLITFSLWFKTIGVPSARMLTIAHFDTLGLGAILALIIQEYETFYKKLNSIFHFVQPIILIVILIVLMLLNDRYFRIDLITYFLINIISICLIIGCLIRFKGIFGMLMNSKYVLYLGRISYGLYIYHKPIPYFIKLLTSRTGIIISNELVLLIISLLLTVLVAHLSFQFIENKFILLKEKYDL